jgi:peptidoglycan/xylan/chitin deacetylase (PgdA/CDA1 family)
MNRRRIRAGVSLLLAGVLIAGCAAVWIPDPLVGIAEMYRPDVVYRAPHSTGMIAVTIDDGPHPETTPEILDVLDRHGVWATFFLLGENARDYPELMESIRDRGHEIGNHLMRDEKSVSLGREVFARDLARADSILAIEGPKLFRPGSGWFAGWMLEEAQSQGYRCVLASAYVQDTKIRSASFVAWLLKNQTQAGDIVVLHEGRSDRTWAPEVLDELIPYWQSRGWRVGTVGDLLAKMNSLPGQ